MRRLNAVVSCATVVGSVAGLDCRDRSTRHVPLEEDGLRVVISNSNVKHELVAGEYTARRNQCPASRCRGCLTRGRACVRSPTGVGVSVDGVAVGTSVTDTELTSGGIALGVREKAAVEFDDVLVTRP